MANIDDLVKESATKTSMASKIGSKLSDVLKNFESDPNKVYDKCKKFVESIDLSKYPSEMHEALQIFKSSSIFETSFLEGLDKKTLGHVSSFVDTLETLMSKEASFGEEKSPMNKEYADIQKAFREFSNITQNYESALSVKPVIKAATKEEQIKSLNINSASREISDLVSAFEYMGMKIMPDGNGSYTCMEVQNAGVPYIDASGKTQYLRISKEATQSFINGYLKNGGLSLEKEESELAEQMDRLKVMRENQKEGGFYAPSNDEVARQEKLVEKARKDLETKKSKKITPKGLFGYFVEKELVAKVPRSSQNKELIRSAREKYSVDAPEVQVFSILKNPDIIKDDMAISALHLIKKNDMETMSEIAEQFDFADSMTSDFANGLRNSGRLENMLDDVAFVKRDAENLARENAQGVNNIVNKYDTLASKLVILSKSYEGTPREVELKNQAKYFRNISESVQVFANAVNMIDEDIRFNGAIENFPEEMMSSENLTRAIVDAVSVENGEVSITKDLVDESGNVWLSKEKLTEYMQSSVLAKNTLDTEMESGEQVPSEEKVPETLSYMLDYEVAENVTLENVLTREAMYDMSIALIDDGNNVVSNIYKDFVSSGVSAKEYVEKLAENGADFSEGFAGAIDTDVLISTLDYCKLRDSELAKDPNKEVSMEEHCVGYEMDKSNASLCYVLADRVALSLMKDKALRGKFESASEEERKKIVKDLSGKNEILNGPFTEKETAIARDRWANLLKLGATEKVGIGFDQMNDENAKKLAEAYYKYYKTLLGKQDKDNKKLVESGEKIVDANVKEQTENVDTSESENNEQNQEKQNGEDNLIEYGKVFPRATPSTKIGKDLQPYNIKVGKKFLDQVIQAFQKVQIQNPWAKTDKGFVGDVDARGNDKKQATTEENSKQAGDDNGKNADTNGLGNGEEVKAKDNAEMGVGADNQTGDNNKQDVEANKTNEVKQDIEANQTAEVKQNGEQNQAGILANYPEDTIRARVAMVSVGMGVNSIIDKLDIDKTQADVIKSAMDYMTLYEGQQPVVSMKINGRTSQVILADAMQYVFLNEFASGNKSAGDVEDSIKAIVGQKSVADNAQLVNMINSMKPLMGAITPAEIVNLVRMTAKIQIPQPGEPMSIEMGSNLSPEDIAKFQKAKSLDELKDMVANTKNVYNQHLVNQIMETEQLRKSTKYKQAHAYINEQNREMSID